MGQSTVRRLGLFISLVLACAGGLPEGAAARRSEPAGNRLRLDVSLPFETLDPAATKWSGATFAYPLLYSRLCTPDHNGRLQPDLALEWSSSPDARTWTVRLRPDARFHDGRPVTSRDAKTSLERMIGGIHTRLKELIEVVEAHPPHELVIRLSRPDPVLMEKIWHLEILPRDPEGRIDHYHRPIGSGPFRFESRDGDRSITLAANPDYFGGRPALDEVALIHQPDRETTWSRLLAGATDAALEISPLNYRIMGRYERRFHFHHFPLYHTTTLLLNTTTPPFDDVRVRRALALALDRGFIIEHILRGYGRPAVGPMWLDSPFHDPALVPPPFAPQRALDLLQVAGWSAGPGGWLQRNGKSLAFTLLVPAERPVEQQVARYLQLALNDIGIRVRLQARPYVDIIASYNHNAAFEALLTEFRAVREDPTEMVHYLAAEPYQPSMAGGFEVPPDVEALIRQAVAEPDPARQQRMMHAVEKQFVDLAPGIFLYHKTALDMLSRRFRLPHPFALDYPGIFRLREATLDPDDTQ